jgi:hypothetical protein
MLQIVLLAGKFVFLIVLYLFIWRVVLSINRDLRFSLPTAGRQAYRPTDSRGEEVGYAVPSGAQAADSRIWALVVVKSPRLRSGESFAFPPGATAIVGRSPDMDIYLDDTFVSSKHALFESSALSFQVEDLHSTNGTLVNGHSISGVRQLREGDRVEVGDTIFQVEVR